MSKFENQIPEKLKEPTVQNVIDAVRNKLPLNFIEQLSECKNVGEAIGELITMLYDSTNNINPNYIEEIEEMLRQKGILE